MVATDGDDRWMLTDDISARVVATPWLTPTPWAGRTVARGDDDGVGDISPNTRQIDIVAARNP